MDYELVNIIARKGTGHPTSQCRWPRTSVLSNRHFPTYRLYMGLTFTFTLDIIQVKA